MSITLQSYMQMRSQIAGDVKPVPLWVDNAHQSDENFKKWFETHLPVVEAFNQARIWNEWNNLMWYTGDILDFVMGQPTNLVYPAARTQARQTIPFWVSHVSDLLDKRATDLASLKPNFEVQPSDREEKDRVAARVVKPILKHLRNWNNLDMLFDTNERANSTYGKSFIEYEWNDKVGDRKPDSDEWEGEVTARILHPWHVLAWPTRGEAFQGPCAIQIYEILHREEVQKKYNVTVEEMEDKNLYSFSSSVMTELLPDEVPVYRVIYKPDQFLREGAFITCLRNGKVLRRAKKYPYSHYDFPWEMHTDITMPGCPFSWSVLNYLKPLQWTYNVLGGIIRKSIYLGGHPKWMMPRGACNIQSLGGAFTVVQHKIGQQPNLVSYNVVGADTMNFRDSVKSEMRGLAGSTPLSSGEVPPNTRSGIQISRLMNIEKMNRSYQLGKRNDFMRRGLKKQASVAGDYYPKQTPEHVIRIVGKDLVDDIKVLAASKISSEYEITIENAGGFSDDLAGRLEEVAFAAEKLPGLLTPQQQADIIGLRSKEKFYDVTTAAIRLAEKENEIMNDGGKVDFPDETDDHITHWNTHVIDMQTPQHKALGKKAKERKLEHLSIHEEMMMEIAEKSPAFQQKLMMLDRFPLVFEPNYDRMAIEAEVKAEKEAEALMAQASLSQPKPTASAAPTPEEEPVM